MEVQKRESGRGARLFVIGAGASYGAGLPDATRVLGNLFLYATGPWMPTKNRSPMSFFTPLVDPLAEVAGRLGGGDRFPLEELAAAFHDAAKRDPNRFVPLLALFYTAIREMIYCRSCERAEQFAPFVSNLRPGDLILTFNWDMCVEICVARHRVPLSRSLERRDYPDAVRLLKPHGSVDDLIVKKGTVASIGPHAIAESYGLDAPQPANWMTIAYELVRLRTYDQPLEGELRWDDEKKSIELKVLGERSGDPPEGEADLFPFQLERMLGDVTALLLTPATPRLLYDWMYQTVTTVIQQVDRPIESIVAAGYSFPEYDKPVFAVLKTLSDHFGNPPTHIVNPAAADISEQILDATFGSVTLHPVTFDMFDWSA